MRKTKYIQGSKLLAEREEGVGIGWGAAVLAADSLRLMDSQQPSCWTEPESRPLDEELWPQSDSYS